MTISLYDATVPAFLQQLGALQGLLAKAEAFCADGHATEAEIQDLRLADDMAAFSWQVRWGAVHSIQAIEAARAGGFSPQVTPPPATFAEQNALLADAVSALSALGREDVNGLVGRHVVFSIPTRGVELPFTAENFLLSFSLPNFYFHVTTAYDLLRNRGVPVGKMDFLGAMRIKATA